MLRNSFITKKNTKLVKQSKMITDQPKTFENPNIVYITSVITKHTKTSQKLSRIIRKDEKVGLIVLYIVIQKKIKNLFKRKKCKNV